MTLTRRHPLKRRAALKSSPRRQPATPEQIAWGTDNGGYCPVCLEFAFHLEAHHVFPKSRLRQMGRDDLLWDQRNRLLVCSRCHERHTSMFKPIPLPCVPEAAVEFVVDLLGGDLEAADFFRRAYLPEVPDSEQHLWRWQP